MRPRSRLRLPAPALPALPTLPPPHLGLPAVGFLLPGPSHWAS